MNKFCCIGRLTRTPEIKYTSGETGTIVAHFSIAISRKFKNSDGKYEADFLNCTAFGKTAQFIEKYFDKGSLIGLTGRIQTGSYINKEGIKIYTTDIVVEEVDFAENKNTSNEKPKNIYENKEIETFVTVPENSDELPFL